MKRFPLLLFLLILSYHAMACCGAYQERIIPIGTVNKNLISVRIAISRDCDFKEGKMNGVIWKGIVQLVQHENDTIAEIMPVKENLVFNEDSDTALHVNVKQYMEAITPWYDLALEKAKGFKGFEELKPISNFSPDQLAFSYPADSIQLKGRLNTSWYPSENYSCGFNYPIFHGLIMQTQTGDIILSVTTGCGGTYDVDDEGNITSYEPQFEFEWFTGTIDQNLRYQYTPWHSVSSDKVMIFPKGSLK